MVTVSILEEVMSSEVKVIFEYNEKTIRDPLEMGSFSPDQESAEFDVIVKHNSNKPIRDCAFYITPYDNIYDGSATAREDFDRAIWFGNNYEGYGISVHQEYQISGEVFEQQAQRLIDITREEETDFFSGNEIEMLSGSIAGEKVEVLSYDPGNNLFFLQQDFSVPVVGERYKMEIETNDFIKSQSGTSPEFAIPLLYNGGKIGRFEFAKITLKIKIPPFMKSAGNAHLNFNMIYTPEE
jgi:hypothetical protein